MNIRTRILLAVLPVVVVGNASYLGYVIDTEHSRALAQLQETIRETDRLLGIVLVRPLYDGDVQQLNVIFDSFFHDANMTRLVLDEYRGDIRLDRERAPAAQRGTTLESKVVVMKGNDALGEVRTTYSTALIEQRLLDSRNHLLLFSGVLVFGLSSVIVFAAARLARPIGRLTAVAQAMAGGELDQQLDVRGAQELVSLTESFARMRDGIRQKIAALAEANEHLRKESDARERAQGELAGLASILHATSDMVSTADPNGRILFMNGAGRRMTGLAEHEDLTNFRISDFHPKRVAELILKTALPVCVERGVWSGETALLHRQGHEIPVSQVIIAHKDEGGALQFFSSVARDITERKRAEEELRVKDSAMASAMAGITMAGLDGKINYANAAWLRMHGYEAAAEVIGTTPLDHARDPADATAILEAIKTRGDWTGELVCRRRDGSCFPAELVANLVTDGSGQPVCLLASFQDITARKEAEVTLRKTEAALEEAQRIAHLGSWEWDAETDTPVWSKELCAILEVDPAQPPPKVSEQYRLYTPESMDRMQAAIARTMQTGAPYEIELERVRSDGTTRWLLARGEARIDDQQRITGLRGTVLDITARKQAEQALLAQEKRFRSLIEHSTDIIALLAPDGAVRYLSPAFDMLLGFAFGDWLDRSVFELIWTDDLAAAQALFRRSLDSPGEVVPWQLRLRHKDGNWRWMEGTTTNFVSDPLIGGIVVNCHDITDRKRADDHIRQQAALLEASHDSVLVWDKERGIQFMNPAAEELTGITYAEAQSQELSKVLRPRSDLALRAAIQEVTTRGVWNGELTLQTDTDDRREVASRWTVLADHQGRPTSILITCNDITEKKRLEQQYLRSQRLESLGTLAGGVAHDLNNILTPILMGLDLLNDTAGDAETRSIVDTMRESAGRGRDTVKQLLTFARGTESQKGPVHLEHLLKEIVRLIQQTFPKNIQVYLDCAEQPATVLADPSQLHQVLLNLCVNARDAMPEGGVLFLTLENRTLDETTANRHPKARPISYVVFKVSDNGTGIPPEIVDRIFEPFFTTKPQGKGTGLGLATALGIVESHGGFVQLESKPGQGTTFQVFIPASTSTGNGSAVREMAASASGHGELILIVDDEPAITRMAENILRRNGYNTLTASGASEALHLFEKNQGRVRAVLTDIMMPFGDGRQLISMLSERDPNLAVIAMSGVATGDLQRETTDRGAKAFLRKPFTSEQLLAALLQLL